MILMEVMDIVLTTEDHRQFSLHEPQICVSALIHPILFLAVQCHLGIGMNQLRHQSSL